jgi:hypothetical protein
MTTTTTAVLIFMMLTALVASTSAAGGGVLCDVEKDLVIWQSLGEPQRDESAMYKVDVTNQCAGDGPCAISKILLRCGNFRSLVPVDSGLLRVVRPGVCLLNGGHTVRQNSNFSFVYASYVRQNLYVLSARCQ